jgi:hypothetical protein
MNATATKASTTTVAPGTIVTLDPDHSSSTTRSEGQQGAGEQTAGTGGSRRALPEQFLALHRKETEGTPQKAAATGGVSRAILYCINNWLLWGHPR